MLDRIFLYDDLKNGSLLYLNAPYNADPDKLLILYVNWHNNEFAPSEDDVENVEVSNFKFKESRCAIDFYDDYKQEYK